MAVTPPPRQWLRAIGRDPAFRAALAIFLIFRVITAVVAVWTMQVAPPRINWSAQPIYYLHDIAFTTQGPLRAWLEPWYRWDTGWYIHIAYNGYQREDGSIIFAPLYPFAIRLLAPLLGGDYLLAGIVISNLCCILAFFLLYKLVATHHGDQIARRTLLLFAVFPTTFYLMAAYTESLFMALLLGAWIAAEKRRYVWAGIFAFGASLTRSQGWILALPIAYIVYIDPSERLPRPARIVAILKEQLRQPLGALHRGIAVIGGPLGTLAYLLGMELSGLGSVSEAFSGPIWRTQIAPPWESLIGAIRVVLNGTASTNDLANLAAFVFAAVLGVVMVARLSPPYWAYVWVTLGFILLRRHYLIQLHGMLRYTLDLFPIFIVMALLLRRPTRLSRTVQFGYTLVAGAAQVFLITLFATWLWVS
jgi:hypothetical protein